jgi:hypothetical protein
VYVLVTSRAPLRVWFYNVRARRLALAICSALRALCFGGARDVSLRRR